MSRPEPHPLDHHPSFRAMIEAAPPLAALEPSLVGSLVIACSDLTDGFAAPPDSRRRARAHHRAWTTVKAIDRAVAAIGRRRDRPRDMVQKAQRAIDRADVHVGALLPI